MRKAFVMTACVMAFAILFTACGSGAGTAQNSQQTGAPSDSTVAGKASGDQVAIRFSTFADEIRFGNVQKQLADFESKNPNIKVEVEHQAFENYYEKKMAETAAHQLPDVMDFTPGYGAYWIYRDLLMDIKPFLAKDPSVKVEDYDQTIVGYFTVGDKLYALPYDTNAELLYYNKDLLDEAGVAYPTDKWTYDDLGNAMTTAVAALKAKGKTVYGLAAPIDLGWCGNGFFDANGTPLIGKDGKIGVNQDTIPMLDMWVGWIKAKLIPAPEPANPTNVTTGGSTTFVNDKSLFLFAPCGVKSFEDAKMNFGVVPPPYGKSGLRGAKLGGGWAANKDTKYPEQAYALEKFLWSEQFDRAYIIESSSGVPAYTPLINEIQGSLKDSAECVMADGYTWMSAVQGANEVWALKDRLLSDLWIGNISSKQWVDEMTRQGNEAIDNASGN